MNDYISRKAHKIWLFKGELLISGEWQRQILCIIFVMQIATKSCRVELEGNIEEVVYMYSTSSYLTSKLQRFLNLRYWSTGGDT
jgi:hypothetical protein